MPNIIDHSYFINDIYLPIVNVTALSDPSLQTLKNALVDKINVIERSILLNSLGLTLYKTLQTELADLDEASQEIKDLVNGVEYDGKIWEGLNKSKSLIAYAVYYYVLDDIEKGIITPQGVYKLSDTEKERYTSANKMAYAWNIFLEKYQAGCVKRGHSTIDGVEYIDFIDSNNQIDVSLYQYLNDKKSIYNFDETKFRFYEYKQTTGIWINTQN